MQFSPTNDDDGENFRNEPGAPGENDAPFLPTLVRGGGGTASQSTSLPASPAQDDGRKKTL